MDIRYLCRNAALAQAARERVRREGWIFGRRCWTAQEDATVLQFHPNYEQLTALLRNRSLDAIRKRAMFLRITRLHKPWRAAEKSQMRRLYKRMSCRDLLETFPDRTRSALQQMGRKMGLRKSKVLKPTGHPLVDQIRMQAVKIGWTMRDLDIEARTRAYFTSHSHRYGPQGHGPLLKAIAAMGGKVSVTWGDDDD